MCMRTRAARIGRRGGWVGQRGETVSTHADEGDKLLIRVFIRAVGRDKRALQLLRGELFTFYGRVQGSRHYP